MLLQCKIVLKNMSSSSFHLLKHTRAINKLVEDELFGEILFISIIGKHGVSKDN